MPALDSEEDFIEDLAHVCRSLERHDWTDIDDIPSEKRGYGLIEACAKNPKGFKKCIKKIAYELQLQDLYVYKFYIKEIKDFGQTYRFILPMQNLMDPDAFVPSLIFWENALHACRLFDRFLQHRLKDGAFSEIFRTQL